MRERYELPAFSVIERTCQTARAEANTRYYDHLYGFLEDERRQFVSDILQSSTGISGFGWGKLKNEPKRPSPHNIHAYIQYLEWLTSLQTLLPTGLGLPPVTYQQFINETKAMDYAELMKLKQNKRFAMVIVLIRHQYAKIELSMSKYHPIASNIMPMQPRDSNETHRAATPLELLFDLVSVIAIAAAAAGLHHAIAEAHFSEGIIKFLAAFFAIWWAWMNYTWFASAYDNNDALFRILTMVVMAGALTMAAGIPLFFESTDLRLIVIGFVIMRVAMVSLWLRAAKHDIAGRKTALSYAIGIAVVQAYWVALLIYQSVTGDWFFPLFALGAVFELMVPAYAEHQGVTPWHRHHLIERYGLLNIIVLGETLLAGSFAVNHAAKNQFDLELVRITVSALIILFAMWWLYFSREDHIQQKSLSLALVWGYGHLIIYSSGAAVGAGFAVLVDVATQHAAISLPVGHYSVAIPVAIYMMGLWLVRDRIVLTATAQWVLPICAVLVLLAPLVLGLEGVAGIMVLAVYMRNYFACRHQFESQ